MALEGCPASIVSSILSGSPMPYHEVDVTDPGSCEAATEWWDALTGGGNEGMVVKPLNFISKGRRGFAQPAIKCRGPEYLRIIYGPEYLLPENLERLRSRGVQQSVRSQAGVRTWYRGVGAVRSEGAIAPHA